MGTAMHKLFGTIHTVAEIKGLTNGYRVLVNTGEDASQGVKHLHVHILGGGWMPRPNDRDWGPNAANRKEVGYEQRQKTSRKRRSGKTVPAGSIRRAHGPSCYFTFAFFDFDHTPTYFTPSSIL